jgi:putative FmdB family regulatory protein
VPTFEYFCKTCDSLFEDLLLSKADVEKYAKSHPCPTCGKKANRIPSATNFVFKGVAEGDPTRKGNSGVHDLDYPSLDKAIGRSANRKWKEYGARKAERDKVRREAGTNSLSVDSNGKVRPADPRVLENRQKAMSLLKKAKSGS